MTDNQHGSRAPNGSQWIEWKGGECPVAGDVRVSIRFRNAQEYGDFEAEKLSWKHYGLGADIIAYRVAAPLETGAINPDNSPDILSGSPETATPRCDFEFPDDAYLQGDDVLKFARTLERECAELLGQHRAANAAIALQDRTIAELRGKLEEAQDLLESAHDSRDLYRKRAEEAEAKLSTARQDALEEAAKVADGYSYGPCGQYDYGYTDAQEEADERAGQIADNIRAIKGEGK